MLERLGNVFYWIGCGVAALAAAGAIAFYTDDGGADDPFLWMLLVFGVISWLVGRALRYVLAGK